MSKQELPTVPCHPAPKRSNRITAVDYPSERATAHVANDKSDDDKSDEHRRDSSLVPLEDQWLGKSDPATRFNAPDSPPPEPPRAAVDPEPAFDEDPRDFDLPQP